jgi:hypothetical protein
MTTPPGRLLLHVGAMKTGTTYVQDLLQANRRVLRRAGWWVPQQRRVVQATRELLGIGGVALGSGAADGGTLADAPRWVALMDEARERAGDPSCRGAIVSMEFLSFVRPAGAALVREAAEGLDLHVALTARDAVRALPSQWQSLTRNASGLSWPDFAVAARAGGPSRGARSFRRTQDLPRMVTAWSGVVAPDRFSVVTVPTGRGGPRDLLWQRLCSLVDVDPATTATDGAFANEQLGYGSCELMRLVNAAGLARASSAADYRRVVRRLTRDHLLPLRDAQTRPRVDATTAAFAVDLNARTLAAAERHATLVGDPADLPTYVADGLDLDPGDRPAGPPDAEVLGAARALHTGAVALCAELGLELPDDLVGDLPDEQAADPSVGLARAVHRVATVMGIAVTGDVSHRP